MTAPEPERHPRDRLRRELSLHDATMLVIASVIGSGIFFAPGAVADRVPHAGVILLAWGLGGLLSLAGALANAELGAMFPRAGGDYVYLREAFHPAAGFLVGWLSFFVIYAGSVATLGVAFADAAAPFAGLGAGGRLAAAVGIVILVSSANYAGVRFGARVNNVTSYLKLVALAAFAVAGPLLGAGRLENLVPRADGGDLSAAAFGAALSPILFTYLGWNASVYVASELRRPGRDLPRSLFAGLGICAAVYLLVNAVYLYALPVEVLREQPNAGEAAARALFGPIAGTLVAGFVLASILGTLNATTLVGPRIAYAMALDGLFFGGVDRAHPSYRTPHRAIVLQAIVAVLLIALLGARFERVLDATTFAIVLATMADTAALYALRRRQPDRPRPYRAWGYPVVPALYLMANGAIALSMLLASPGECGLGLAIAAFGWPFYRVFGRRPPNDD